MVPLHFFSVFFNMHNNNNRNKNEKDKNNTNSNISVISFSCSAWSVANYIYYTKPVKNNDENKEVAKSRQTHTYNSKKKKKNRVKKMYLYKKRKRDVITMSLQFAPLHIYLPFPSRLSTK